MSKISQIMVGKNQIGIIGLEGLLMEMDKENLNLSDQEIGAMMLEKLSKKNYIPSVVTDLYASAFLREYKKFIGEPITETASEGIEIKVLGTGCPRCDQLEQILMSLIEETGVKANLEHIRDIKEISRYGVMGSPALVINKKVKAVGSLPSKAQLIEFFREAAADLEVAT